MSLLSSLSPLRYTSLSSQSLTFISRFSTSRSASSSDEPPIDREAINRILSGPLHSKKLESQTDRLARFRNDSDETTLTAKLSGRGKPDGALGVRGLNQFGAVEPRLPMKCRYCGQEGHTLSRCPTNPNAIARSPASRTGSKQYVCFKCNQPGHLSNKCPNSPTSQPRRPGSRSPVFDGRVVSGPLAAAPARKVVVNLNDDLDDFDALEAKEMKAAKKKKAKGPRNAEEGEEGAEQGIDVSELEENQVYSLPTSVNLSSILYDSMPKDLDELWKHEVQGGSWMGGYGGSKYVDRLPVVPSLPTLEKTGILKNLKDRDIIREEDIKEMHDLRVHSTWHIKHWMPKDPPAPLPTFTSLTSPLPLPTTVLPLTPVRPKDTFPAHRPTFYRTQPLAPEIKKNDPVVPGGQSLNENSRAAVLIAEQAIARNESLGPVGKEIAIASVRKAVLANQESEA